MVGKVGDVGRRPGFVVNVPLQVPECVHHEPGVDTLLNGFEAVLRVAGLSSTIDEEADREDWIEGALRVTSCVRAASARDVPVYAVTHASSGVVGLSPLNAVACGVDPLTVDLVTWGLVGPSSQEALAQAGHVVCDPFGRPPPYALNAGFLANAGRAFFPCRSDDEPPEHIAALPAISDVLRERLGQPIVHKIIDGVLKEYAVARFVPTERELMPEHVAWSVVHRSANVHSVQDDVPMAYEYRLFVVDGRIVSGAGSVMEHTPLDRASDCGTFAPMARRSVRGRGAPERPVEVSAYEARGQTLVDAMVREPGFPRHLVVDLFTNEAGQVGVVEANPLRGSGFFANDADAVADAAVAFVTGPGHVPTDSLPDRAATWTLVAPHGKGMDVAAVWEAFQDLKAEAGRDAPPRP